MAKGKEKSANKGKEKVVAKASVKLAPQQKPATKPVAKAPAKPVTKIIEKAPAKPVPQPGSKSFVKPVAKAPEKSPGGTSKVMAKVAVAPMTNGKAPSRPGDKPATDKITSKTIKLNTAPAAKAPESKNSALIAKPGRPMTDRIAKAPERNGKSSSAYSKEDSRPISTRFTSKSAEKAALSTLKLKCPFATDELVLWRRMLLERRSEITNDIAGLVKDAMEAEDGHTTPNHIAERGSDADLQDMSLGMVGEEETILWQIDRALRKIDKNMPLPFGLCEFTKDPIPKSRLQLIPWTPLSIEGATHMEQNHMSVEDMLIED